MSFIPSIIIIKHYKQEKWTLKTSYLRLKVFKNHNKNCNQLPPFLFFLLFTVEFYARHKALRKGGAPLLRKCGNLPIRENLVIKRASERTTVRPHYKHTNVKVTQSTGMATQMQLKVLLNASVQQGENEWRWKIKANKNTGNKILGKHLRQFLHANLLFAIKLEENVYCTCN